MNLLPPPIVPGLPVVGSLFRVMGRDPRDFLMSQYNRLGPIFRLKALHIDYVIMAGPAANKFANEDGRDAFQSKSFWRDMMYELEADNFLIGLDGEEHAMLRKRFKSNFARTAIDSHLEDINSLCKMMLADVAPGEEFEVVERMVQLTSQMIGCIMTGKVPTREELRHFLYYTNTITNHFALRRLPAWMLKLRGHRFREARSRTFAFAEEVLEEHLTGSNGLQSFVDAVMQAAEKCPHLFAHGDIRFSAILPFFAGIDTLGQTINYALFELHRHPGVLSQVKAEIDEVFSQGIPSTSRLKKMEKINSVIRETLRLHPSAFGLVRTAAYDFQFEGYEVKKGEDVVILTSAPHFMDEYFKAPKAFDIERYQAPRNEHRQRYAYAPFGVGPHTCLGAGMAEDLMVLALGSILYNHEFATLHPNIRYKERIGPTPSLGSEFKLRLLSRRPN